MLKNCTEGDRSEGEGRRALVNEGTHKWKPKGGRSPWKLWTRAKTGYKFTSSVVPLLFGEYSIDSTKRISNFRGSLNTADGRCTCHARMPGSVGFVFLALPVLVPWRLFLGFFIAKFGSVIPNYSRKPPMRSSKAPLNQRNRGQVLPHPLRTWPPSLTSATLVGGI